MKHRLFVAEELVEEGNSLLKICAEKMHLPTFTEGQQKTFSVNIFVSF